VDELLLALHETSGDYERSLDGQSTRRYGNTSEWILKEQHFKDWEGQEHRGQESEDRRMALWLKGDVGVGKSITLATLVSRLQKDTKKLTLYHFCSGGRIKPTQVFASLLHQLLLKEPDLCPYVYWKYFHGQAFLSTSAEKLGSALKSTLSFTKINEVFIILDALDECDDPDNILVETLSGITLASGSCLKVLISSRPDGYMAGVNLASERIKLKIIELRPRFVEKDINTYITEQLDSVLSPSLRGADISRAGNVIKERAGNNWLLTYLLVNDIKEKKGLWTQNKLQEIISKLKTFHGGLYERYDKILDKIPQDARSDAMKLFKWLIIARRPLSLKEASIAIGLKDTHTSLDMLQCDIDRDMGPDKLRKLCGPLIHVDESIGRVTLLHYSVQEYLTNTASTRLDNWWRITLQDASLQIARDCITFLSFSEFSSSVSHPKDHYGPYTYDIPPAPHPDNLYENDHCSLRNLPFLKYAATEWASHLKSCEEDFLNDPDGRQFLEAFLIDKEKNVEFCFRLYQYFGNTGPFQETVSALQVVCYFGLEALVSLVVQTATPGSQGSAVVKQGYSQLEMCALGGHVGIAEQLLKLPQHIQDSRDGKAALTIAVDFGHTALVKCLLQRFPSFDSLSSQLESASVGGHTDIAKLLLEAGADINQGEKYSGPLEAAAYHGHLNMVELLIEWKADIDRFDNSSAHGDGSALHSAAAASQVEIVEKLLKSGANINLICGVYGTALQAAAYAGCMEVVQMLFKDAKDYPCGQYGSALQAAKFVGHTDIVRLLEGTPVDPIPPNGLSVVRTATLDTPARRTLYVFATEISRGRINGVERGIERTIQGIITAIERKNLRTLDFLLPIGVKAFQVVVEIGNENYLERLTKAGMMLLKKTIELKSSEETERLSRAWAKALLWAVEEGNRPNIARRMLELCVGDFQTRVDEGADEEAEQLVHTGIEILLATAEIENPKLLSIFLDVFVAALEQLMDGRFEKRTLEIIDGYADEFRTVLPQLNYKKDGTRARALAIAGALALRNAAENKKVKVTQYFARLYKEIIQWIFNKGHAEHILSKLGSQDNSQTSSGTEIHLGEEVLLVGKCLLQVETTDNNWSKIFRGVVTSATIQALTVAGEKGKFDVIEAHAESWVKGIVCSRPARSTREDIRSIFEVARDEGGPSDVVRKSLERIIMMVDGITEVSDYEVCFRSWANGSI